MHPKHLATLEFPKVLERLAEYASFSGSADLARALTPATRLLEVRERLQTTSEARALLDSKADISIGGAHDIRPLVGAAQRAAVLAPMELLDVRDTLIAARSLHRTLTRLAHQFPRLAAIAARIEPCSELIEEIQRCLNERGEVRDEASVELARIRREARIANERIHDRLQAIIASPANAPYLQEALITQREGRYVIPLKSDFRGRIRGIVHDMSASGATVFIEPLSVVELNNAWRELQLQEQQEVQRILAALSARVADRGLEISLTVAAVAELDLAFAKARYAAAIQGVAPELVAFRERRVSQEDALERAAEGYHHSGSTLQLIGARHPLLDPKRVVPIDVVLDPETYVVIITGPNTGGKTVSLKTTGLLTLMAQAGLHIPVEPGSALSPFEAVYADIGDEQSIEQNLSTFSAHLTNIMSFITEADSHSLVLLDELGAGTDPTEGAALARALLDHFRARRVTTFVATHYPELKTYAQLTPGVCNAAVEFDAETLSPTYRLTIGLPGRSNAFAIAQRLGLPAPIVEAARRLVSAADARTEDMLADIHRLRVQAARARDEANAARAEAERMARELRERLAGIEAERRAVLEATRRAAEGELEALRTEVRALRRRLHAAAAPLEAVSAIEESLAALETQMAPLDAADEEALALPPVAPLDAGLPRPGDVVWVTPLRAEGQVLSVTGEGAGAEAEVQVGPARTRLTLAQLELRRRADTAALIEAAVAERATSPGAAAFPAHQAPSPGTRLDLRGSLVEDALERLDRYLDQASRAGLPWVHIIHGKGTGALRRAVRQFLTGHPLVASYEAGGEGEGGEGVTIAHLVQG